MAKKKAIHLIGFLLLSILFFYELSSYGLSQRESKPVGFAIPFPDLTFTENLSEKEQDYLGIPKKKSFFFREIRGSLILVEFLSSYCVSCQRQAPIFNKLYSSIETNLRLKGKVKMIGIAAGNNLKEVAIFKKAHQVPYPVLSDSKFNAHMAVGSPRIPFAIWVRKDAQGSGIVVSTHLGLMNLQSAMEETKAVLQYDLELLKPRIGTIYEGDTLKPPLAEEELRAKAREGMESTGGKVLEIQKITLKDGDWVYVGKVAFGASRKNLFSKLASRRAICDICHDTFFIYTFDPEGKMIDIVPIQFTKAGNLNWTDEDIRKLKARTIGRSILSPFSFDPNVDSVSGATITAVLIFDSLDKAKRIFGKLKKEGYVK